MEINEQYSELQGDEEQQYYKAMESLRQSLNGYLDEAIKRRENMATTLQYIILNLQN